MGFCMTLHFRTQILGSTVVPRVFSASWGYTYTYTWIYESPSSYLHIYIYTYTHTLMFATYHRIYQTLSSPTWGPHLALGDLASGLLLELRRGGIWYPSLGCEIRTGQKPTAWGSLFAECIIGLYKYDIWHRYDTFLLINRDNRKKCTHVNLYAKKWFEYFWYRFMICKRVFAASIPAQKSIICSQDI